MVDLTSLTAKLKSLTLEGVRKKMAEPIGDGRRSTNQIISIAGETIALSSTGIDPTEKTYHNKEDFERLYVPEGIKEHQQDLEEIFLRMFPLSGMQSKREVLPPDDEDEFDLVRQSLYYRLELLRDEILKDTSDTVDVREKLSRFDRLNKLVASLESNFHKKRTQTYVAVVSSSSVPETKDPKIEMNDETVDDLLRKFGLILLQSQHQLPGFKFAVPPNQIVKDVQSTQLDDEEAFLSEISKEGAMQESIEDILKPDTKEKRLLGSLRMAIGEKLVPLLESLNKETSESVDLSIVDEDKPFKDTLTSLLESLFSILKSFETDVTNAQELMETMDSVLDATKKAKEDCEAELRNLQSKLAKLTKTAGEATSKQSSDRIAFETGAKKLRAEIQNKEAQIHVIEERLADLQEQLRKKEAAVEVVGTITPELERLREDVKVKDQTIKELEAKDAELEPLRAKIADLEGQETLSKEGQATLALTEAQLEKVSAEKQRLEEQLAEYSENLQELQTLVERVPAPASVSGENSSSTASPFDLLRQRILAALPAAHLIPSVLEVESHQKTYTCRFLKTLLQLIEVYFDSVEGQELQNRLTEQLDLLHDGKVWDRNTIATRIYELLKYSEGHAFAPSYFENDSMFKPFVNHAGLKEIEMTADRVFFTKQETLRSEVQPLNVLLSGKDLPSYPVCFFLYLLALRDWVNCIDLSSRPTACPIPERLQRTVKCP